MRVLVFGNGFDLDLGLNTRYSDFAKSKEWIELFERKNDNDNCLSSYLYKKSKVDDWFNIEKSLKDYVKERELKKDYDINMVYIDKWFLKELEYTFDKYLAGELVLTPLRENSLAALLMATTNKHSCFDSIYSFNFVDYSIFNYIAINNMVKLDNVQFVHGLGHDLIFGIDEDGCKTSDYSFLKKTMHPKYPSTNIIPDLMEAQEVVIFGHSLNEIDWKYFQSFFEDNCKYKVGNKKNITIITKDDDSKKQLKDNLYGFGISITSLSSICNLVFVETDSYYHGDFEEKENVSDLLYRLSKQ